MAELESTIVEYINNYRRSYVNMNMLFYKTVFDVSGTSTSTTTGADKLVLASRHILSRYKEDLGQFIIQVTLDLTQCNKYFYNPRRYCYDTYGTTELWFLVLELNEMSSITQFNVNPFKAYNVGILNAINTILNLEKKIIDQNNDDIFKETK
jgi:hypothetical protein